MVSEKERARRGGREREREGIKRGRRGGVCLRPNLSSLPVANPLTFSPNRQCCHALKIASTFEKKEGNERAGQSHQLTEQHTHKLTVYRHIATHTGLAPGDTHSCHSSASLGFRSGLNLPIPSALCRGNSPIPAPHPLSQPAWALFLSLSLGCSFNMAR